MTDFRHQYKKRTLGFGNTDESRILRAEKHTQGRKLRRAANFSTQRDFGRAESPVTLKVTEDEQSTAGTKTPSATEDRMAKLMKWKAERDMRKKLLQQQQKPVFRVGIVSHNWNSPVFKDSSNQSRTNEKICKSRKQQNSPPRRTTRATEKRMAAKLAAAAAAVAAGITPSNAIAAATKSTKISTKIPPQTSAKKINNPSFAPQNHAFRAPKGLSSVPLFGLAALQHDDEVEAVKKDSMEEKADLNIKDGKENIEKLCRTSPRFASSKVESPNVKQSLTEETAPTVSSVSMELSEGTFDATESISKMSVQHLANQETCITPNSSFETITLRLSPEQMENLDCPVRKRTTAKCEINTQFDAPIYSPYVVSSRGKSSARKERQTRLGIGCSPSNDIPTKETVMQNLNISVEEEERTAQYFRFILDREVDRLNEICSKWSEIKCDPDLPEEAEYLIHQAIGQTKLLITKKFERFRSLVSDCETGKGLMLVTCRDLQGFWDMMFMEVENCDARFRKLEALRAKGWEEEQQPQVVKKTTVKKAPAKKKVTSSKHSSVRAMIQAARKKKIEQQGDKTEENEIQKVAVTKPLEAKSVESPNKFVLTEYSRAIPGSVKKKRMSLLQQVQMSETRKTVISPLAIIKISKLCKTSKVKSDDSITYVNSDQTPGKGILKRLDEGPVLTSARSQKSLHKVNFNDDVSLTEVPLDEETQNKMDLAAALKRIDSYDFEDDHFDDQIVVRAEKKLYFSDDSFEEMENGSQENTEPSVGFQPNSDDGLILDVRETAVSIPNIVLIPATPRQGNETESETGNQRTTRTSTRRRAAANKDDDGAHTTASPEKNISSRKSNKKQPVQKPKEETDEQKENKRTPRRSRRNSLRTIAENDSSHISEQLKGTPRDRRKSSNMDGEEEPNDENTKRRRSSRKSVRFTGEDCTACAASKPVHPMTPHTRRSASKMNIKKTERISLLGEATVNPVEPFPSGDLIAWESPVKPPSRVKRSLRSSTK